MNKTEKRDVKDEIRNTQFQNIEMFFKMAKYTLLSYLHSVFTFGLNSDVTKRTANIWYEFLANLKEEKLLMDALVRYAEDILVEEAQELLEELDSVNDDTILYYYECLDSIDDACDMKQPLRAIIPKKFDTLIDTNKYRNKICDLTLNIDDIVSFMNLPDAFWKYINRHVIILEVSVEEIKKEDNFGVDIKLDNNGFLTEINLTVPKIIDLETTLINVKEYKKAYNLYLLLGKKVDESKLGSEEEYPKVFLQTYIPKKYKKLF